MDSYESKWVINVQGIYFGEIFNSDDKNEFKINIKQIVKSYIEKELLFNIICLSSNKYSSTILTFSIISSDNI